MIAKIARLFLVAPLALGLLGGCIVARPARPCPGGVWVGGHYDRRGVWRPEHWRCPGVVEEEIIIR